MPEPPLWKTRHFVVTPGSPPIPGYLIVRALRPATSLATLTPASLVELGKVLAQGMKLIERVVAPERVYVLRFGEEVPAIHFHLFPRTKAMGEAYRKATGAASLSGPAIFEWVRKELAFDGAEVDRIARRMKTLAQGKH